MPHDFKRFPELSNRQMQIYYFDSPHKQLLEDFTARVVKVTDGDTIRVEIDDRDFSFPIRFSKIDAPEIETVEGIKSQSWLESEILNKEVEVLLTIQRVEKWGRLLAEIRHMGISLNQLSMDLGYSAPFGKEVSLWD